MSSYFFSIKIEVSCGGRGKITLVSRMEKQLSQEILGGFLHSVINPLRFVTIDIKQNQLAQCCDYPTLL